MNPNIFKWLILNRYVVFVSYWHQTIFRYQMGGGHIAIKRRKKDWEGGFVKRRLKFVFITGACSLSTFLLISRRYSVWFDLFVFATLKFVELRKNIQKRWWLESLNWKSKQHPLNSTWKKAHLGYYKWQTFSAQYFNMDKSDQITSQWITLLDSLTLSYWIVGASVGKCRSN